MGLSFILYENWIETIKNIVINETLDNSTEFDINATETASTTTTITTTTTTTASTTGPVNVTDESDVTTAPAAKIPAS